MTGAEDSADSERESFLGPLSIIGALSLCCVGFGAIAGGAAVAGGTAAGTAVAIGATSARGNRCDERPRQSVRRAPAAIGATSARGTLISLLVTALTVVIVAAVARRYLNRS